MATLREIISYLRGGGGSSPPVNEPPPIVYNPVTNLPSVESTVRASQWRAEQARQADAQRWVNEPYVAGGPPPDRSAAARHGHPAGQTYRDDPYAQRRAARSYGGERPLVLGPGDPRLQQVDDRHRDHRDDPQPRHWIEQVFGGGGGGSGGGRGGNDLGHPPGCGCTWCGG